MQPTRPVAFLAALLLAAACSRAPVDPVREGNVIDYTGTGALQVDMAGLPTGVVDTVTVSGPPGVQRLLLGGENPPSQTLTNLTAGRYTVTFVFIQVGRTYCNTTPSWFSVYVSNSNTIGVSGKYNCVTPPQPPS